MRENEQFEEMQKYLSGKIVIEYESIDMFEALKIAKDFMKKCSKDIKNAKKSFTHKTFFGKLVVVFARFRHNRKKNAFTIVIQKKI